MDTFKGARQSLCDHTGDFSHKGFLALRNSTPAQSVPGRCLFPDVSDHHALPLDALPKRNLTLTADGARYSVNQRAIQSHII
jgi:hypothetical protein